MDVSPRTRYIWRMKPGVRARVIAEWRGYKEKPFPKDTAKSAADLLAGVLKEMGLGDRLREEEVLGAWREVVGDFIAQHAEPRKLLDGVLHVRVLQPSMLYELDRTMRPEIMRKLKQHFGRKVRDVKFRVG